MVWGGVRREPASESFWDEPNQYINTAKVGKNGSKWAKSSIVTSAKSRVTSSSEFNFTTHQVV